MGCSTGRADRCRAGGVHVRRPSRSTTTYRAPAELTILDYLITRSHKENKPCQQLSFGVQYGVRHIRSRLHAAILGAACVFRHRKQYM
jgi:hypothetical protein